MHTPHSRRNRPYGLFVSLLALMATPALSQPTGTLSLQEFQERVAFCQTAEEWLRAACMEAVYEAISPTGAPDTVEEPQTLPQTTTPASPARSTPQSRHTPNIGPTTSVQPAPSRHQSTAPFTELHLVGIYEPQNRRNPDGTLEQGRVPVRVDRPGERVALVLSSYEPVVWDVTATPGTTIIGIAIGGYEVERMSVFLDKAPYTPDIIDLPIAYQEEGEDFHPYYKTVLAKVHAKKAASFHGAYAAPAEGFVIDSAPGVATQEEEQAQLEAGAIAASTLSHALQQALELPIHHIEFGEEGFSGSLPDGHTIHIPLPHDMPRVSWPSGAAHDPIQHRLWGATFGGEGVLYAHDMPTNTWKAYSLNNVDVGGIIYDPTSDSLVATPGMVSRGFLRLDTKGNVLEDYGIDISAFVGITRLYDPGNGPAPTMVPLAIDNGLLLVRAMPDRHRHESTSTSLTYLVDLDEGTARLVR